MYDDLPPPDSQNDDTSDISVPISWPDGLAASKASASIRLKSMGASISLKPRQASRGFDPFVRTLSKSKHINIKVPTEGSSLSSSVVDTQNTQQQQQQQPQQQQQHNYSLKTPHIDNLKLTPQLFASSYDVMNPYDPAVPNDNDYLLKMEETGSHGDSINNNNASSYFVQQPQELNYTNLSKTIGISGIKSGTLMDDAILPLLRCFGSVETETYFGDSMMITYVLQTSCIRAYHSLAQGEARTLCKDEVPFVWFVQ